MTERLKEVLIPDPWKRNEQGEPIGFDTEVKKQRDQLIASAEGIQFPNGTGVMKKEMSLDNKQEPYYLIVEKPVADYAEQEAYLSWWKRGEEDPAGYCEKSLKGAKALVPEETQ